MTNWIKLALPLVAFVFLTACDNSDLVSDKSKAPVATELAVSHPIFAKVEKKCLAECQGEKNLCAQQCACDINAAKQYGTKDYLDLVEQIFDLVKTAGPNKDSQAFMDKNQDKLTELEKALTPFSDIHQKIEKTALECREALEAKSATPADAPTENTGK